MRRALLFASPVVLSVLLGSCGQLNAPPPDPLPALREAALGETASLNGAVEDGALGRDVDVQVYRSSGPTSVGTLQADGRFSATLGDPDGVSRVGVMEALGSASFLNGPLKGCGTDDVRLSDPAARVYVEWSFGLRERAGLRPQLSPASPMPVIDRRAYLEVPGGGREVTTVLVHSDRDVSASASRSCVYAPGTWSYPAGRDSVFVLALHLSLKAGWNTVTVDTRYVNGEDRRTVYGGEADLPLPWRYNGVPLR